MDSLSSLSPPVKLVPLSDLISLTWPLLAINRFDAIKKRIRFQAVYNFYMYRTDSEARENDSISFHKASITAHLERTKAVNPNRCKGWSVRGQPINKEVSHFLFAYWALAALTVNTLGEYSSYDGTGLDDPKLLARQT